METPKKVKIRSRLFFRPDGTITALYQDELRAVFPEIDHVYRVSDVQYDHEKSRWVSKLTVSPHAGRQIAESDTRAACIAEEHHKLEKQMLLMMKYNGFDLLFGPPKHE
jgi:hypothetical protein